MQAEGDIFERYYTPARLRWCLENYPTLLDNEPQINEIDKGSIVRQSGKGSALEQRICVRADVQRALESLDWLDRWIVVGYYTLDLSIDELAETAKMTPLSAAYIRDKAIMQMANFLGWVPQSESRATLNIDPVSVAS